MATTINLTVRNILKKGQSVYKDYAGKAVAFCFDIWENQYINKTGERGKILEINGISIETILENNLFHNEIEFTGYNNIGYDRVKLETVGRYTNNNDWYIMEPEFNSTNPAPYLGIYRYLKLISSYPGINPITGDDLAIGDIYIDSCLKAVVFGFIDNEGFVKDIQGTCGSNITITCESGYVPIKLTGCRIDIDPKRIDCSPGSINFDFTTWNNRNGWSGLIIGDIPISK